MKEEWRPVVGYENRYIISNIGRVASKRFVTADGKVRKPRLLVCHVNKSSGYRMLFTSINGKKIGLYVHRLVAEAFIKKTRSECIHVNHIDGDKLNASVENLEWVTPKENWDHAFNCGLTKITIGSLSGDDCPSSKIKEVDVIKIKRLHSIGLSNRQVSTVTGISKHIVSHIRSLRTWSHVALQELELNDAR